MSPDPRGLNHPMAGEETINGQEVGVYRASAVGYCEWALLAARMGMEPAAPPDEMQKVFSEGHDNEETILRLFYQQNKYLSSITAHAGGPDTSCELWIGNTILIRGHVDELAEHAPQSVFVLEAKAVGKSLWHEFIKAIADLPTFDSAGGPVFVRGDSLFDGTRLTGLWEKYRDQLEVYMAATGATQAALIVGRKPDKVEGEERGLVEEIEWVWVTPDVQRLARIKTKIAIIEGRSRGGVSLPGECPTQQYPCPYFYMLHPKKEKLQPITIEDDELAAAMRNYMEAGQDEKDAKKKKESAKAILDVFFGRDETADQLAASVGKESGQRVIGPGIPVVSGEWTATYVERDMPASNYKRKAYTQKFYQVVPNKKVEDEKS